MTRTTYLRELKKNLSSLSESEISDAIAYYSNYFDDADDDQKVINELGTPSELAGEIIERSKKHLIEMEAAEKSENNSSSEQESDALYYEFDKKNVKSIQMNLGAAEIVFIPGKKIGIESRGIESNALNCNLSSSGLLSISNQKRINFDIFTHNRKYRAVPRILIILPENLSLETLKIRIGAGSLITKNIGLSANNASFEVEAGNLTIENFECGASKFRCGMGNLTYEGSLIGHSEIDCGMGNVKLTLKGNKAEYSYDGKVGLGDFKINDEKKSGVGQIECSEKKSNHLSVNVGMGNVSIKIS